MIATEVCSDGRREVLGFAVGDSEDGAFWAAFLRSLKARGLAGCSWSSPIPTPASIRTIFAQPDATHVHDQLDVIAGMLGRQFPKLETMLRDSAEDANPLASRPSCQALPSR